MKILRVLGKELEVKLSHSFMQKAQCPYYLKCNYVDKIKERYVRVAAERGKACHEAIFALLRACIEEGVQPRDLDPVIVREVVQRSTPYEILGEMGSVLEWVSLWAERYKLPAGDVMGIEEKVGIDEEFEECDFSEASYRGVIDIFQIKDVHAIITDWKSQPHILSQTDLDANEQMTMYCWLVWKMNPHVERFTARIWYLRYGFYGETFRTDEDLERFEHALMMKEKKICDISNWDPIPGPQCQYCDFIMRCPITKDLGPENSQINSQQQAIIAAQKVTVMDGLLKLLKAGLREYVKKNDEVMIGDNWIYGYKVSKSQKWDLDKIAEVLEDHDHDLTEVVKVNKDMVKKILKQSIKEEPALAAAIDDIAEEDVKTQFAGYQRKPT